MRIAVAASALLHLGLIVFTMIAWPGFISAPPSTTPPSIDIELVEIAEKTNIRPERKVEEKKPEPPKEEPKPEPPKEEPKPEPKTAKAPPPAPEPEPEVEPAPPEPEAKPEPEEKKPEPKPEEKKPAPKPEKKPDPKPQPKKPAKKEDDVFGEMAALLDQTPKEEQQERVFHEDGEDDLSGQTNREGVGLKTDMTVSMLDALKLQIEPCWNIDAGAKNAGELVIDMMIEFNPDGTLRPGINNPRIKNQMRYNTDSYFRAAADAAVMAVRECEGDGYKLPPNTPVVNVTFDPSKMVGGR